MPQIQGEPYVFSLLWNKTPAYFPLKDTLVGVDLKTSDQGFWRDLWCLELEYRVC